MFTIYKTKKNEIVIIDLPESWVRSWNKYKRNRGLKDPVSITEFRLFLDMLTKWWRFHYSKKDMKAIKKT